VVLTRSYASANQHRRSKLMSRLLSDYKRYYLKTLRNSTVRFYRASVCKVCRARYCYG